MINLRNKVRALGRFMRSRAFAVSMLSVVLAFVVFQITTRTNVVYYMDQDQRTITFTMEDQPEKILQQFGSGMLSSKDINFSGISGHFAQINADHLLEASITVDGATTLYQVKRGTTVGELLYQQGITYDGNDLLSPASDKPLEQGDKIQLQRVEYERYTVDKPIPYKTVHKNTSLLRVGATRTIQPGIDGINTQTYVRRTVDGVKEDVQLLGEHVTRQPVTETILIGSVAAVSPLDFDLDVDEHGKPMEYARLLTEQIATGYSARPGAKTASGRYAVPGHVAVDPREIPYGSKLYIVSRDNSFIYGCAIAADTGTGLMQGIVDVDLFYDTYAESALNGRKILDIYVLE
ncbi:G5 domain-containing protein [Anaerotruncus rubiinfantis]|uniref:G5 domain-containing protein n=2 Tax=Anaerotruncus rubiinfantis TaxID=1720200 RepID=UPI0034A5BF96